MKNYVEFKLNGEQTGAVQKIVEAIRNFNDALSMEFLNGCVSYETQINANLFFTLDAAESILFKNQLWKNQAEAVEKEMMGLDWVCENKPEELTAVEQELKNLQDAFTSCKSIMKLIEETD